MPPSPTILFLQRVFLRVLLVRTAEVRVAVTGRPQRLVEVQVVLGRVQHASGNVRAVVGGALQVGE